MKLNNFYKNLNFIYYNIPIVFARLLKTKRKEVQNEKGSINYSVIHYTTQWM